MKKLTAGLIIFAFVSSVSFAQSNEAEINQFSDYNDAEITQDGEDNSGYIKQSTFAEYNEHYQRQFGQNNDATASVYADNIEGMQVQDGKGNVSALNQASSYGSAVTFQVGLDQAARVHQSGGSYNTATVIQGALVLGAEGGGITIDGGCCFGESSGNTIGIKQDGSHNEFFSLQVGENNSAGTNWWGDVGVHQQGVGNSAGLEQYGFSNDASIMQDGTGNTTVISQGGAGSAPPVF
jgi:hypothetical protein